MPFNTLKALLLLLPALLCAPTFSKAAQQYDAREHYTKTFTYITMRDGARLYTVIYAPKDRSRTYPILMIRTPYSIGPYTEQGFNVGGPPEMVQDGYIFVRQDVRGRFMSEGNWVEYRPEDARGKGPMATDESTDAYDTIDWLVKSVPNNNGKVGVWGISYPGFYAAAAGIHSHPALKAISPQAPVTEEWIGDDDHHNGALFLMDFVGFYSGFGVDRPGNKPATSYPQGYRYNTNDAYKYFLDLGPLKNLNARLWNGKVAHWNDVAAHPDYDAWWKERALQDHMKGVGCAVMTVGGWFDAEDRYGPFAIFRAVNRFNPSTPNTLVVGPWTHGGWAGGGFDSFGGEPFGGRTGDWYLKNRFVPFFRYYLKGEGAWNPARATVFATGANQWWGFDSWPPRRTTPYPLELGDEHTLKAGEPDGDATRPERFDAYVSDPANPVPYVEHVTSGRSNAYIIGDQRFAAARPDVATWQSEPLSEDLPVAGNIPVDLRVSTTGSDADFIVKVIDVLPGGDGGGTDARPAGFQRLVRGDVMRARYRESLSAPKAMTPGRVTRVAFDLQNVCHVFRKGHRIMVQVQSSWFPLVDRNPQSFVNIYTADESDFRKATIRIYHNSRVTLPRLQSTPAPLAEQSSTTDAPN